MIWVAEVTLTTTWWTGIAVGGALAALLLLRSKFWQWPKHELVGYAVWLVAGGSFAVPELWAALDSNLGFPTLSGTVGHLERRYEAFALPVVIIIVYAVLNSVRIGLPMIAAPSPGVVEIKPGRHLDVAEGRVTSTATSAALKWWPFGVLYSLFTAIVLAAGFVIPWGIHDWHASDAEKQLGGEIGYGLMGIMFFVIPAIFARFNRLVPFPGLFATMLKLEARSSWVAVIVAGSMTFLMLHLAFYPYPSIIPWFVDLEDVHDMNCVQHFNELICRPK